MNNWKHCCIADKTVAYFQKRVTINSKMNIFYGINGTHAKIIANIVFSMVLKKDMSWAERYAWVLHNSLNWQARMESDSIEWPHRLIAVVQMVVITFQSQPLNTKNCSIFKRTLYFETLSVELVHFTNLHDWESALFQKWSTSLFSLVHYSPRLDFT